MLEAGGRGDFIDDAGVQVLGIGGGDPDVGVHYKLFGEYSMKLQVFMVFSK